MRRPPNEPGRLLRLRGLEILDTDPEAAFDQIIDVAADVCEAPIAFISLLDETRQWFKACRGIRQRSTPRTTAFCNETILSEDLLIVEDALKDPRFANNPLVTGEPGIRFYAGAPLVTEDKFVVGTLCVLDKKPRALTPPQAKALQALARQTLAQIELRHKLIELKSTIDSLGETERRFRLIADASPILMWISDQAGNRTFSNAAWCEFTGLSREESIGDSWLNIIHPDDREVYFQAWTATAGHASRFQREFRLCHTSGTYRWVLEQAIPLFSSAGRLEAYVSSCVDLSSRNVDELAYQNNEARFRAVSEAAPLGIFVTDSNGNFIYTNHRYQQISGQSVGESLGLGWLRSIVDEDRERIGKSWSAATQAATPFEETYRYQKADGSVTWCSVKAAAINTTDTVNGWVGTVEDVTGIRKANEEIVAAKQAAENAMHAKSQFLANMSHEIRTPLTAILGFAESLRDDLVTMPEQLHTLEIILNNGKHLLQIINEILDLAKIDAGAMKLEKSCFNLVRLIEEVRTMFAPRIAEKALSFSVHYDWPLPEKITSDPLRLKQVLINLLSNAIKFTQKGWIGLRVGFDGVSRQVHFTVSDSGIGIQPDQLAILFQPFCQANESITRQFGGTGLGLSISQRLVQALGGEINVTSELGGGSTFKFSITPDIGELESLIKQVPEDRHPSLTSSRSVCLSGRVLFADDALDNRRLVAHLLGKAGISPMLVEDGQQALDAALAGQFDLILLDIQMPHLDGLSAARAMRSAGIQAPIVALSAGAMTSDVVNAINAGCSMHLSKPFTKESFLEVLERFLPALSTNKLSSQPPAAPAVQSTKVLTDEDLIPLIIEFVTHLPHKVREIREALTTQDSSRLTALAHRLRGSAGLYGYPELCSLCGDLERTSKDPQDTDSAALVERIETMMARIQAGKPSAALEPPVPL